jgi:AraC family transcriptional regulator of adaptative response / DNA-3-methyladenine glycosylase II
VSGLLDQGAQIVPLQVPAPFHGEALLVFFGRHAVPGIEVYSDRGDGDGRRIDYARTVRLPHGPAGIGLAWEAGRLTATLELADPRDAEAGRQRIEHLCDLGTDPSPVTEHLSRDRQLRSLVAAAAGLRVPGTADLHEHLFRTMIGQQISLAGAANCAGKLVDRFGEAYPGGRLRRLFPTAASLAAADPETLPMPRARGRALVRMAEALAGGTLSLTTGSDQAEVRTRLLAAPGVGPWTADYLLMRGLHQPDILLSSDLVIKRELAARSITDTTGWAPWRSYATMHLWRAYTG